MMRNEQEIIVKIEKAYLIRFLELKKPEYRAHWEKDEH